MMRVGLTGGLASGKSLVGRYLTELGCHSIQADKLGHEVLLPGGPAYAPVLEVFGREILDQDDAIDRRKLAELVFADPKRLETLNNIVHPLVIAKEKEWISEMEKLDPQGIAVVEAAILIETGSWKRFDKIVLAVCTAEQQIARAMHRDKITYEQAKARLENQMPLEEKMKFADYIVDTSGPKEATHGQVVRVYEQLKSSQLP